MKLIPIVNAPSPVNWDLTTPLLLDWILVGWVRYNLWNAMSKFQRREVIQKFFSPHFIKADIQLVYEEGRYFFYGKAVKS